MRRKNIASLRIFAWTVAFSISCQTILANDAIWTERFVSGPSARATHAMAYDIFRGETILFGGRQPQSDDTWRFRGGTWELVTTGGPSARNFHMMAYDSNRNRIVLFGGIDTGARNDTWEWDGSHWTQIVTSNAPEPRENGAMVFDGARGEIVLFGGYDNANTLFGDTWTYNGIDWTYKGMSGPSGRQGHRMAFDAARSQTVLFGGSIGPIFEFVPANDTWTWDGTSWTLVSQLGDIPPARGEHAMAYDAIRQVTVMFGGLDATRNRLSDTWEWNGASWTNKTAGAPPARLEHAMVFDSQCGRIVVFGGSDAESGSKPYLQDTWDYMPNPSDTDGDGLIDTCDNCPTTPNADQSDCDGDNIGDACESDCNSNGIPDDCDAGCNLDDDSDDHPNCCDNCPSIPNPDQADGDGDGYGDVCDDCPMQLNPTQIDTDSDGLGDLCDNCPNDPNPGQEDCDNDGHGDACGCGFSRGDMNDDGLINGTDIQLFIESLLSQNP